MITDDEFAAKLPVWHAFSELFRDTEMSEADYRWLARELDASHFPPGQLRAILVDEVAPAFFGNLMQIAGEWAGWSEDSVRTIMIASILDSRAFPLGHWPRKWLGRSYALAEWEKLSPLLGQI